MSKCGLGLLVALCLVGPGAVLVEARPQSAVPAVGAASAVVPQLVKFSGKLLDEQGHDMKGPVGVTFAVYREPSGGAALWMETQNVKPDASGNYLVLLGAASVSGIPVELFASGEARWLGIQVETQPEQPRVQLVSVPYALKSGDAQTLNGRPASDFALAGTPASVGPGSGTSASASAVSGSATPAPPPPPPPPPPKGTVTSVGLSAPASDFTVTGSPVTTSGTLALSWNTAPTSASVANTIVKRDASGSFSAANIGATSVIVSNAAEGAIVASTSSANAAITAGGAVSDGVDGITSSGTASGVAGINNSVPCVARAFSERLRVFRVLASTVW